MKATWAAARLDVDPVEGPIVTELFERRAAGEGWQSLRHWLESTGTRPGAMRSKDRGSGRPAKEGHGRGAPPGEADDHREPIRLIGRRVYLGELDDERHSGVVAEGTHPPLTDPITFKAANERRGSAPVPKGEDLSPVSSAAQDAGTRWFRKTWAASRDAGSIADDIRWLTTCPAPSYITVTGTQGPARQLFNGQMSEVVRRLDAGESYSTVAADIGVGTRHPAPLSPRRLPGPRTGLDDYVVDEVEFRDDPAGTRATSSGMSRRDSRVWRRRQATRGVQGGGRACRSGVGDGRDRP